MSGRIQFPPCPSDGPEGWRGDRPFRPRWPRTPAGRTKDTLWNDPPPYRGPGSSPRLLDSVPEFDACSRSGDARRRDRRPGPLVVYGFAFFAETRRRRALHLIRAGGRALLPCRDHRQGPAPSSSALAANAPAERLVRRRLYRQRDPAARRHHPRPAPGDHHRRAGLTETSATVPSFFGFQISRGAREAGPSFRHCHYRDALISR